MKETYVISINREFGSMGRPIAKKISEILGIEYYDRDIVDKTAKKLNKPISMVSDNEEKAKGSSYWSMKFPLGTQASEEQDQIFRVQREIMIDLAKKGNCIMVGRCSDYVLDEFKNHLKIYIYAPVNKRYDNCVNVLMMNPDEARKMIKDVDKARRAYHMRYAGYKPGSIEHNHILVDSSVLGVEKTAENLAKYIQEWINSLEKK